MSSENAATEGVAIIGMAGRFPGARDIEEFWSNLELGIDSISHFTKSELQPSRWDPRDVPSRPNYVRARGVLEDADRFDAAFFGITPLEAAVMDPQQRVFLEAASAALESAGYDPGEYSGVVGVWAGQSASSYLLENVWAKPDVVEQIGPFQAMVGNARDYLATRVSYKLGLRGPSVNVSNACSTSLVAVCQACQALLSYQCDMALGGGVSIVLPQKKGYLYQEGGIGSPDGRCRPFDAEAAGTVFSDGLGVVVLKRLEDALSDGDSIYAVIRGAAVNNDGSDKMSFTAPGVEGQAEVIAMAQALAGVDPETITYVETHGTATPLGDPIEIAALTQAFRATTDAKGFCAIGSVKSNIGHLDAGAGVAGLIKTALALHHGRLPPSLHFTRPNPQIDFESSPFYVNTAARPWPARSGSRRAGVSSFGIGGTNAHVVLEEAPEVVREEPNRPEQLLVLSARSEAALDEAAANLARHLRDHPETLLADVAHTLQVGRRAFPCRRAVVGRDPAAVAAALEAGEPGLMSGIRPQLDTSLVFLFPGQGAQSVGMTSRLYRSEPVFRAELDGCAEALRPHLGLDIRTILYEPESGREEAEARLAETAVTQPTLFAVEYALARLWMSWGLSPAAMIGHSLGEYVAACLAGVMTRDVAAAVVATRGRLMQAQPRGSMLSVRMPADSLAEHLGPEVCVAGLNAPELTVVSGLEPAIEELEGRLGKRGISCRRLATSHAFHSASMDGAMKPFRAALAEVSLSRPNLPWISCLTGDWITPEEAVDPEYWVQQLRQPVRFSDGVRRLAFEPGRALLEVGPGHSLSMLVRQHRDRPPNQAVVASLDVGPEREAEGLLAALGRLWISGATPDWAAVHGGSRRRRVPLPTYPFERRRYWIDPPPVGKPELPTGAASDTQGSVSLGESEDDIPFPVVAAAAGPDAGESGLEGRMTELISTSSGIPAAEIDPSVPFLELGFDSLLLIQVSAAIERTFGVGVTFRRLIEEYATVKSLASHVAAQLGNETPSSSTFEGKAQETEPAALPVPEAAFGRDAASNGTSSIADADRPGEYPKATTRTAISAANGRAGTPNLTAVDPNAFTEATEPITLPLSEAQREIWAATRWGADASCAYNVSLVLTLGGRVDVQSLRSALQQFVDRHEALRMTFDPLGETVVVQPSMPLDVPLLDLSGMSTAEQQARLQTLLAENAATPFDLADGPPVRARIVIEASDRALLVFTAHHIVFDGWAGAIVSAEIPLLYGAAREGKTPSLPPTRSFGEFLQTLAAAEERTRVDAALEYWRARFADGTPLLDLPLDHARPPLKTFTGAELDLRLGEALRGAVRRLAGRKKSTIVGFLLATFQVLLHRLTGQADVVVGLPVSIRPPGDTRPLVGHATNFLPIRVEIDSEAPFSDHLNAVKATLLDAQDHQATTFGSLVRELQVPRDPSRTPLVTTAFNVASGASRRTAAEAEREAYMPARSRVTFELDVNVLDTGHDLVVQCTYNTDLFEAATVRRWLGHYRTLLEAVVAGPETPVGGLPLLTGSEREAIESWNRTEAGIPEECVHDLISTQAARTPDRVAAKSGGKSLTYRELEERSSVLARRLRGLGVKPGVRVGVYLERGLEMVVGVLGVLKAGGAYVPLDPAYPLERLRHMVEDSGASVLLTHAEVEGELPTDSIPLVRVDEEVSEGGAELEGPSASLEDLAYVIYTSGSTGKPKGVAVTHRNLVNFLASMGGEPGLSADDVLLSVTTLSFDIAALELYLPLVTGARVVVASRREASDGRQLLERLEASGATVMQATPATWRLLIESGWESSPGLKVLCGGEALTRELGDELLGRAGEVWNVYGPTETTVWSSVWRVEGGEGPISIGRPIANTQLHVLDAHLNPQPVGVPGELYIGGAGVARGYWERPDLTAERFVADPFSEEAGARMYRTGDLARRLGDGHLECLGRIDHQVKVRGFRIELGEIETALRQHAGVAEAVVIVEDAAVGDRRLVAYLTHGIAAAPTATDLRSFLRASLPDHMVPALFVALDALPLTPNGKVDRKRLHATVVAPMASGKACVPPRTEMEKRVAEVWKDALGVESISITDNFFDLGGHSLLAVRVLARLETHTGRQISLREIVFQTLEQFASGLESKPREQDRQPQPRGPVGRFVDLLRGLVPGSGPPPQ